MNVTHRHRIVSIAVGSFFAAAAFVGTAAQADAKPIKESTIKSECKAAGGTYTTHVDANGNRVSTCTYRDIGGGSHWDLFHDGVFVVSIPE